MTMVQRRLWNKPIRTETNSVGPGSTARPFTTSYRTNECVAAIFPPLLPIKPSSTPSTRASIHFLVFFQAAGHHEVFDFLSSTRTRPPSLAPSHRPGSFVPG